MKNTVGLLDIAERLGLLKGKYSNLEDFLTEYNGITNQLCDNILNGIKLKQDFETPTIKKDDTDVLPATEKQRKAVWAIIHGDTGKPDLEQELTCDIDDLCFKEASDFIDRHGRKTVSKTIM